MGVIKEMSGKVFNGILILSLSNVKTGGKTKWKCKCHCGAYFYANGYKVESGHTKSCGCLKINRVTLMGKNNKTHGMKKTRPYRIWVGMRGRCNDKRDKDYHNYGGRGIKVCNRWLSFINFWEDMKLGYVDNLTIDRIDNNGNYELSNCRWSTRKEQANNSRRNRMITFNGMTKTLAQWAEIMGVNEVTLGRRVKRDTKKKKR